MIVKTKAIALNSHRYSEADLIVRLYTATDGLKSYLLRGVLKTKKGKIKSAMFQPLSMLEIVAMHKNIGRLEYLKEAKLTAINPSIRTQIQKSSIAIFLTEVIRNAVQEEEQNEPLFAFFEQAIQRLETEENTANFHLQFLVDFTKYLGIYPQVEQEDLPYFNLQQGQFEAEETDNYSVSGKNCVLLKTLLQANDAEIKQLRLQQEDRQKFLVFILSYYEIQLQGFRQPQSLEVLAQLFA